MKVEREIEIGADPEAVYEVLTNPHRLADWVSIHEGLEDAPDTLRKGSTLTQTLKLAGRCFTVRWKVVENERAERVVWEGQGPVRSKAKVIYELDSNGDGTHFTYTNEYHLPGGVLGRMAGPAVRRVTAGELDRSLKQLKAIVEV
jgi:carbon monoxide dehydrogenase subunit G